MIRTGSLTGVAVLMIACGGASPGAGRASSAGSQEAASREAASREAAGPDTASPATCPELDRAIENLIGPVEEGHELVTRQCVLVDSQPAPTWFAVGSIGQPDDSESEEGWSVIRFLADAQGRVLARGPDSGAGWMTGVSVGDIATADLDGDGNNEVLETRDEYGENIVDPTAILTVYQRKGDELVRALSVVLHQSDQDAEHPGSAPAACSASYKIVDEKAGARVLEIVVRQPRLEPVAPEDRIDPADSEAYLEALDDGEPRCLDAGTYHYRFPAAGATGTRVK